MNKINLYSQFLTTWYDNYYTNSHYKDLIAKTLDQSFFDYPTINVLTMSLTRRAGATTAIKDFKINHSDLKILVIVPYAANLAEYQNMSDIYVSSDINDDYSAIHLPNYDIVFIDGYYQLQDKVVFQEYLKYQMTLKSIKNTWIIKFG